MAELASGIDWNSLLHQDPGLPFLVVFGIAGIVATTAIVAVQWRKAQQVTGEARLKELMIQRGFNAEEIKSVINAGLGQKRTCQRQGRRAYPDPVETC